MRLIDLDDPRVVHLLGNLEPKWKPMAEFEKDELFHELSSIVEEFEKLIITDMGSVSDGFHTFDSLYHQRLILFAALVNTFPTMSWKSHKHSDGEPCFGGGWFIVGISTPKGSYTYHYENKDWDVFHCQEVETAPEWDGHTDKDVERLLSLVDEPIDWAGREVTLACVKEREMSDKKGEESDGIACYESALRAYRSLMRDSKDQFYITVAKGILNRLLDGKCLSPIEDTPDVWSDITGECNWKDGYEKYQCIRMSSLFKEKSPDGTVAYSDINRVQVVDIDKPETPHTNGFTTRLIDKIFPITMPYFPANKRFKVVRDTFLFDKKNGDYDTVAFLYIITPSGKRIDLNRYFKEIDGQMVSIEKTEFDERKAQRVDKKGGADG